jgi:DinB family protein
MSNRPAATEGRYIPLVPEDDIIPAMEAQARETERLLRSIGEQKATFRYAPDKWTIKTLVRHFTDTERIFAYRLLAIARGEKQPLPGFEENDYAAASAADERKFSDLIDEYRAVRAATLALLRGLPSAAWERTGTASGKPISVRAIAFNTLGHERHHLKVLREKYGVT